VSVLEGREEDLEMACEGWQRNINSFRSSGREFYVVEPASANAHPPYMASLI